MPKETVKDVIPTSKDRADRLTADIHKLLQFHGGVFYIPAIRDMIATELRMYAVDTCLLREGKR